MTVGTASHAILYRNSATEISPTNRTKPMAAQQTVVSEAQKSGNNTGDARTASALLDISGVIGTHTSAGPYAAMRLSPKNPTNFGQLLLIIARMLAMVSTIAIPSSLLLFRHF